MILYGGRRSPFVRRVELWLAMQERPFERRYVNAFATNFDGLTAINPLGRVPALTTDRGEHLFESSAIIDYLEDTAEPGQRLIPATGPDRWRIQQVIALSHGIAEKGIALYYETRRRPEQLQWQDWQDRLSLQITNGLKALDEAVDPDFIHPGAVEIAAVCAYDINLVSFPRLVDTSLGRLAALSDKANRHPAFARTRPVPD